MESSNEEYIIAYDIGTEGAKTTLVTTKGEIITSSYMGYSVKHTHPNWAEQNPEDWWTAVCKTTRSVIHKAKVAWNYPSNMC